MPKVHKETGSRVATSLPDFSKKLDLKKDAVVSLVIRYTTVLSISTAILTFVVACKEEKKNLRSLLTDEVLSDCISESLIESTSF